MFSQGYGASQVGFSQDMHDISQSDSGLSFLRAKERYLKFRFDIEFTNLKFSAWPKSQLDLLSQDQGYDAYNPSHGRGMDFSQY